MRHLLFSLFLPALCLLFPFSVSALAPEDLTAEAAVLIDAETGQVLYAKNATRQMYPASITKILTCLLAIEELEPDAMLTASERAVDLPSWGSGIDLRAGESLSVNDALYALMLPSANDAANVLAEAAGGSLEGFAELMNAAALAAGARNTQFTNAHGLPDPAHYTTAYDMALITRYAMASPHFLTYFGAAGHTIPATNLSGSRELTTPHYMLVRDSWAYYPQVIGGKIGYTDEAGRTMSTAAVENGRTLICVVMNSGSEEKFHDTAALLDSGFGEFTQYLLPADSVEPYSVPIVNSGTVVGEALFTCSGDIPLWLHDSQLPADITITPELPDSLEEGEDAQGYVLVTLNGGQPGYRGHALRVPLEAAFQVIPEAQRKQPPVFSLPAGETAPYRDNPHILLYCSAGLLLLGLFLLRPGSRHRDLRHSRQRSRQASLQARR